MIIRLMAACTAALCFALPAAAFDLPDGYEKIGGFRGDYNGKPLNLISVSNQVKAFSDLHFVAYADQNQQWVKGFTVQAAVRIGRQGKPEQVQFSVEFDQNPETNALDVARVILVDQTWDTPLVADLQSGYGTVRILNLVFDETGTIKFDISATLIRLDFQQYNPLPNQAAVHIKGRYQGEFPQFALQYPFVSEDD